MSRAVPVVCVCVCVCVFVSVSGRKGEAYEENTFYREHILYRENTFYTIHVSMLLSAIPSKPPLKVDKNWQWRPGVAKEGVTVK